MTHQNLKESYFNRKLHEKVEVEETITISLKEYQELYQVREQLQKLKSQMLEHCDILGGVFIQLITDNYYTKHEIKNINSDY
jgi:hypothetical protein